MLSFQQLSLRRQSKLLVEDASLTIYAGFKVGLVGANGSGKTSLFKLILGELDADQGRWRSPLASYCAYGAGSASLEHDRCRLRFVGRYRVATSFGKIAAAEAENDYTTISAL